MQQDAPPDAGMAALAGAIGARVRQERRLRGWTLEQLAQTAGISRRRLIDVEQGGANPSVGTLLRIADALGIGLPALVAPPQSATIAVTRAGTAPELWRSEAGGRGVLVAGIGQPQVVELWDWTLAPGDEHRSEPHLAGARELVQVRSGALVIGVGDQMVELGEGDGASFAADIAHDYRNPGERPAVFSLVVFEPAVGTGG